MGFPVAVGYTEVLFPKVLLHILSLLGLLRTLLRFMGLHHFPDADMKQAHLESLPLVNFMDLADAHAQSCAVCLTEFEENDEIRRLANCGHIFHGGCLERWMGYDQRTCPLCRTAFKADHNHTLWVASPIPQLYLHFPAF
ncbi:probable E3 ubiquitin-protein ligase RHA1A [Cajanus cajan]|uniref:RING-H2 zinc finger protein RHA1a n=1 Tax=Cajanus cajan TaxID=3821 RepID=A0A151TF20_CAJCA|nr:probable E3 ubiquitin-protein ligase RHA1A [Cajanus cajan]KYP65659.1 RING-H2 zinc finger protein RHA1a [Cajanus cajan]